MRILKLLSVVPFCLLLAACFQTSLGGTTGRTALSVAPLRNPSNVLATGNTRGEQYWIRERGQETWDTDHPMVRLLLVGMLPPNDIDLDLDSIDPAALYLVTASGGEDMDPASEGAISETPEPVQGSWHAIVTGQRLIDGNIQVSALSEALYQQARTRLGELDDDDVLEQLNAAARLVVGDIDNDGSVNYADVMDFMRSVDADLFRGDITALDALSAGIRAGQPQDSLEALSASVLGSFEVVMTTSEGDLVMDTLNWETPVTVDNFLRYIEADFYDNVVFHRVINGFVIQTGLWKLRPDSNVVDAQETRAPIRNESRYSISNLRGTVAMARTSNPDSATSQFYVNQGNNTALDFGSANAPEGYTVFAVMSSGLAVVDEIASIPTGSVAGIGNDVPSRIVTIDGVVISD